MNEREREEEKNKNRRLEWELLILNELYFYAEDEFSLLWKIHNSDFLSFAVLSQKLPPSHAVHYLNIIFHLFVFFKLYPFISSDLPSNFIYFTKRNGNFFSSSCFFHFRKYLVTAPIKICAYDVNKLHFDTIAINWELDDDLIFSSSRIFSIKGKKFQVVPAAVCTLLNEREEKMLSCMAM